MNFIEKKKVSFIPQADKIIIDPKSIRSIPKSFENKQETISTSFERYNTTSKSYAVLKVQYFEALVTFLCSARFMQILKTTQVSNYNLDFMVICHAENIMD